MCYQLCSSIEFLCSSINFSAMDTNSYNLGAVAAQWAKGWMDNAMECRNFSFLFEYPNGFLFFSLLSFNLITFALQSEIVCVQTGFNEPSWKEQSAGKKQKPPKIKKKLTKIAAKITKNKFQKRLLTYQRDHWRVIACIWANVVFGRCFEIDQYSFLVCFFFLIFCLCSAGEPGFCWNSLMWLTASLSLFYCFSLAPLYAPTIPSINILWSVALLYQFATFAHLFVSCSINSQCA